MTPAGGVASILAGMVTTLGWEIVGLVRSVEGVPDYPPGLETAYPAPALSVGTLIAVSLVTQPAARTAWRRRGGILSRSRVTTVRRATDRGGIRGKAGAGSGGRPRPVAGGGRHFPFGT